MSGRKVLAFAGAFAVMAALGSPAKADDWSGFYAGVNAGIGTGNVTGAGSLGLILGPLDVTLDQEDSFDLSTGFIGGVQAGYNQQNGSFVFGIETDFNFADLSTPANSALVTVPYPDLSNNCNVFKNDCIGFIELGALSTEVEWFGTARGRLGHLLADDLMVYATGGLAYGKVNASMGISNIDNQGTTTSILGASSSDIQVGYTVGGGVEAKPRDNLTVKLEYLYVDLGTADIFSDAIDFGLLGVSSSASAGVDFHTVRVGVNWHFNSPL